MTLLLPKPQRRVRERKRLRRGKPPARKSRPRAQRKGKAADARRAAHAKWRAAVLRKNWGACIGCLLPGATDPAHIYPKSRYPHIRYLPSNGLPLCRPCHDYYTRRPLLWQMDVQHHMSPGAFARLRRLALERRA